jgi:MOSC domain-containing protein YiiM
MSVGRIEGLFTYAGQREAAVARTSVGVGLEGGLEGDHRRAGHRAVTVLSLELWKRALADAGAELPPETRRANVVVSGVDLPAALGKRLRLGEVEIEVLGEVRPCERMDEAHPGLRRALEVEMRGGVHGRVLRPGTLYTGDPVEVLGA